MMYQAKRGHRRWWSSPASRASATTRWTRRWPPTSSHGPAGHQVGDAGGRSRSLLRVLRRAIKIAATPPMGPVFVCLPMDILDAPNDEPVVPDPSSTRVYPEPDDRQRCGAAAGRRDPPHDHHGRWIAYVGRQAELPASQSCSARTCGAPTLRKSTSTTTHPLFKGTLGHMFGEHSRPITPQADAVLIMRHVYLPRGVSGAGRGLRAGRQVIHVDLDAYEIAKNFPVDLGMVGDPEAHPGGARRMQLEGD